MRKSVLLILLLVGIIQNSFGQKPELVVQKGHSDSVDSVAFSPDEKTIATGSQDKTIKIWNIETGKEIRSLDTESWVEYLKFSLDGNELISRGADMSISYWNVKNGQLNRTIPAETFSAEEIRSFVYSSNGNVFAVGVCGNINRMFCQNGTIRIWGAKSYKEIKRLDGFKSWANSIAFSPDEKLIASGSGTGEITIWDLESGQKTKVFEEETDSYANSVNSVKFSFDQKILGSLKNNQLKLWDIKTESVINFSGGDNIKSFQFSPDRKSILLVSTDNTIKLWNIVTNSQIKPFEVQNASLGIFSPDGMTIVSRRYNEIKLWNVKTGNLIYSIDKTFVPITTVVASREGSIVAYGGNGYFGENFIRLWDIKTGIQTKSLEGLVDGAENIVFSPNEKLIAASGFNHSNGESIKIWNVETGQLIQSFKVDASLVFSIAFSPDGKTLASCDNSSKIKLWDVKTGQNLKTISALAKDVAFLFNNKTLITANNHSVSLWKVDLSKDITILEEDSGDISSLAIYPKENLIAVGKGKTIDVISVTTGNKITSLEGHSNFIVSLAFSSDGKTIVSGSFDKTVRLWDVKTGSQIKLLKGHTDFVKSVSFLSNKNDFVISGSRDGTMKIWNIQKGKEFASLLSFAKNDWLITTPEGFFDGTPNAWKQLIWRFNNNTFDYGAVELYFNDFFYPNLLQDVLAGNSPQAKAGQELEKIDRRQPSVEIVSVDGKNKAEQISTDKRNVKVLVEVADNADEKKQPTHNPTSGAQDLRLFRNGSLVKRWDGDVFDAAKSGCEKLPAKANEPRRVRCEFETALAAGANDFTVYAFNSANVKSNDDAASVEGKFAKRDGTLYVLAIGVNDYVPVGKPNGERGLDLDFAVPDVLDIGKAFEAEQKKLRSDANLKQYENVKIVTLKDETATKDNILLALSRFAKAGDLPEKYCAKLSKELCAELTTEINKIQPTQPEDALVIYFAGHGTSRDERFYLLPHNFDGKRGADSLDEQGVSDVELNVYLEKVDAGKLLMVIDACQSGKALGAKSEGRAPMNSKGLAQLAYDKGMLILTATQSQEAALETPRIGDKKIEHGLLTYALLEAFSNKEAANKDGNTQLWEREWFDFAVNQVPILQREAMKQRDIDLKNKVADVTGRSGIYYVNGDKKTNAEDRNVQTPRVFYRREPEIKPFILANP